MTAHEIADLLSLFIHKSQITELRALNVGGPRRTVAGWFDGRHLHDLARTALALTRQAAGVYFIPNPVHPSLLARCPNRAEEVRGGRVKLTTDADVIERRYLIVDLDPDRSDGNADQPSTQDEFEYADCASSVVELDLTTAGWNRPARMASGNGVHLVFPLTTPLPAKPPPYELDQLRETLHAYREWRFCGCVSVDPNTYTAARMLKVPGTWGRKGTATTDRPYRLARVMDTPADWPTPTDPPVPPESPTATDEPVEKTPPGGAVRSAAVVGKPAKTPAGRGNVRQNPTPHMFE